MNPLLDDLEFRECNICALKPGSPVLCESCLMNRKTIADLKQRIKELEEEVNLNDLLLENRDRLLQAYAIEWAELGKIIFEQKKESK